MHPGAQRRDANGPSPFLGLEHIAHVARNNRIVKSVHCLTNQDHRATSCPRKGEGAVFLSSVKDNQSVDEKSLGSMHGFVRTEARPLGKLRRDITP